MTDYTDYLIRNQNVWWKRIFDVQRPFRMNLKSMKPGFLLDIGCGIGRNLKHVEGHGIGIDLDSDSVNYVRTILGYQAFTPDEFSTSQYCRYGAFDSLLVAHVLEHLHKQDQIDLIRKYAVYVKPGGKIIVITPMEICFKADPTHVCFVDHAAVDEMAHKLGMVVERAYSFPFPRIFGKIIKHNEFISIIRVPINH